MVSNKFTTASPYVVSYSYNDIADGTGVQTLYGINYADSTGTSNTFLSQTLIECNAVTSIVDNGTATFDLTQFITPRDITGTAYIECLLWVSDHTSTYTFKIYHYDGTTATQLGTATTKGIVGGVGAETQTVLVLPLTTKHFNKGDILRVTVFASNSSDDISWVGTSKTNPFKAFVPFSLNI